MKRSITFLLLLALSAACLTACTNPEPSPATPDNQPISITKDFDGVELTIGLDKSVYSPGEEIQFKAVVKNNTNETIYLCGTPVDDYFVGVSISENGEPPYFSNYANSNFVEAAIIYKTVEPGEEYTQHTPVQTHYVNSFSNPRPTPSPVPPGTYIGLAGCGVGINKDETGQCEERGTYNIDFELEIK